MLGDVAPLFCEGGSALRRCSVLKTHVGFSGKVEVAGWLGGDEVHIDEESGCEVLGAVEHGDLSSEEVFLMAGE